MTVSALATARKYKYLVHVFLAVTAGVVMITAASQVPAGSGIAKEILDELGVAVIVAALVTLMYETYAREVLSQETMTHVLEAVIGDMFDSELWSELRNQLLNKPAVRRGFSVRIRLERDASLPSHQAILWVSVSYRLHALHKKADRIRVHHYLDRFMKNDLLKLPRFVHIAIGDRVVDAARIDGQFDEQVDVTQWSDGVPIIIERREIVYTPGAYNLLMSDLTALETVQIEDVPEDVEVDVNWTLGEAHKIGPHKACSIRRMLLPGHSIEFRFHAAEKNSPAQPVSSAHAGTTAA
jgi:hypothetical protein